MTAIQTADLLVATPTIAVAVCERHAIFRRRLLISLESEGDIAVVAEEAAPGELDSVIGDLSPRVLAVDLTADTHTADTHTVDTHAAAARQDQNAAAIARMVAAMPHTAILALAGPNDDPGLALLAGAKGAITKTDALRRGRLAIRSLAADGLHVDRRAARSFAAKVEADLDHLGLNRHHIEVLHQVSSGRTMVELARFFRCQSAELELLLGQTIEAIRSASS